MNLKVLKVLKSRLALEKGHIYFFLNIFVLLVTIYYQNKLIESFLYYTHQFTIEKNIFFHTIRMCQYAVPAFTPSHCQTHNSKY